MPADHADLPGLLRDTVRETARSWRLPAALALGVGFGLMERSHTGESISLAFGVVAALYTTFLGPLPWRALVPLEADGQRARKLVRWLLAAPIALALFALLVLPYVMLVHALDLRPSYLGTHPRELAVSTLLFLVAGWGLARDVQLEQRLDRTIRTHGKLAAELEEARLYALRADLDPHFLFNALNAIASQCASDPRLAEENVVRLSSLLRAVLDTRRRPLHSLDEELELARDYLGLLAARYPALRYRVEVKGEAGEVSVPPLLLQPLLENAVRHGAIDAGEIRIEAARRSDGGLAIEVRSPGRFRGARDGGMGLELVRRRVALAWGAAGGFTIEGDGEATIGRIIAPAVVAGAEARSAA
jgi:hypothetical protein